ncbi:MAG: hypothetical protein OHK0029_25030 [Armatimonadaceae bacterium]
MATPIDQNTSSNTPEEKETFVAGSGSDNPAPPADPPTERLAEPATARATSPPTPPIGAESADALTAEAYIENKLHEARQSLLRTQVLSVLLAVFVIGYVGYITYRMNEALEPRNAAEIAQGLVASQVERQGPELIAALEERIPKLIRQAPEYALEQMPEYRNRLEDQIVQDMQQYFRENSQQLSSVIDEVLTENREEIRAMLEEGDNPAVAQELGNTMEERFMTFLEQTPVTSGETITVKLDESLKALKKIEGDMERLASGNNLTEQEQQARRAIAILAQTIR